MNVLRHGVMAHGLITKQYSERSQVILVNGLGGRETGRERTSDQLTLTSILEHSSTQ
jgi:hypothetical protein